MTKDEALKLCDYLECNDASLEAQCKAAAFIRQALAQPEQEPVALETVYETIIQWDEGGGKRSRRELARRIVSLYTTPPKEQQSCDKREWVELTDEQRLEIADNSAAYQVLLATEAKLKEKNT